MNTSTFKSLTALTKQIKKDQEAGILQMAIVIEESVDKEGVVTKEYVYSRPIIDEEGEE